MALLKAAPEAHAVKLQLARLLITDRPAEAAVLAKEIINAQDVAPTIRIASWVELARTDPTSVASR